MENYDGFVVFMLSLVGFIVGVLITRWIFNIGTIVRLLKVNGFLLRRLAEKNDALNEKDKEWVNSNLR